MNLRITITTLLTLSLFGLIGQQVSTIINDASKNFESIHWHKDGRILCVDYNNGRLYDIKTDGTLKTLATGFAGAAGGGFDEDGTFYFSELGAGKIYRLNSDNTTTLIASGLNQPTGILPLPNSDQLLVGQYQTNSVLKINKLTGAKSAWISGKGLNGPDAVIAFDNEFLIANFNDARIFKADIDGNVTPFWSLGQTSYLGYLVYTGGKVYTPAIGPKQIYEIDSDGTAKVIAGSGLEGNEDGNTSTASFTLPNGICANPAGDTILITDGSRVRVLTGFKSSVDVKDQSKSTISISPNPTTNNLTVSLNHLDGKELPYRIFDMSGQLISSGLIQAKYSTNIDVSIYNKGTYILAITDSDGNQLKKEFLKL